MLIHHVNSPQSSFLIHRPVKRRSGATEKKVSKKRAKHKPFVKVEYEYENEDEEEPQKELVTA